METPGEPHTRVRKVRSFVAGRAAQRPRSAGRSPSSCRAMARTRANGPLELAQVFGRDAKRVLDIGFGDGEALVTNALNNPTVDYLGIEVHEPGIGHLLLLLEQAAVTNMRVIVRDAAESCPSSCRTRASTPSTVLPGSVAEEAPSQAPPRAAAVRRELARVLKPGGCCTSRRTGRTTRATRARCSPRAAVRRRWSAAEVRGAPLALRPPTKFERRGVRLGHEVADLYYRTRAAPRGRAAACGPLPG